MGFYDIELIDISENIENFKFHKISKEDLDKIINTIRGMRDSSTFEFACLEGNIVLLPKFFRGLMYSNHVEIVKTIKQENHILKNKV